MSCYRTCSHCGAHIGLGSAGRAGPSPPLVFLEQRAQGDRREEYHFPLRGRIPPPHQRLKPEKSRRHHKRPCTYTHPPKWVLPPFLKKPLYWKEFPPPVTFPPLLPLGGWGEAQKKTRQHSAAGPHWARPPCKVPAGQRPG